MLAFSPRLSAYYIIESFFFCYDDGRTKLQLSIRKYSYSYFLFSLYFVSCNVLYLFIYLVNYLIALKSIQLL